MSYRCEVCANPSPPGQPCLRYILYRNYLGNKVTDRELKVCKTCHDDLELGVPLSKLQEITKETRERNLSKKVKQVSNEFPERIPVLTKIVLNGVNSQKTQNEKSNTSTPPKPVILFSTESPGSSLLGQRQKRKRIFCDLCGEEIRGRVRGEDQPLCQTCKRIRTSSNNTVGR